MRTASEVSFLETADITPENSIELNDHGSLWLQDRNITELQTAGAEDAQQRGPSPVDHRQW